MGSFFNITLTELGLLLVGVGFIYTQWKIGGNKASAEVLNTYKIQVEQLREELKEEQEGRTKDRHDLKNEIQTLGLKLARLEGENSEKDKKLEEYKAIFQGKSPEQEQYMKEMREFTIKVAEYMNSSTQTLKQVSIFMQGLNKKVGD